MQDLPKDLIKKLINEYLDGRTAFSCLTVNKRIAECVNKKIVMEKYLKYISYKKNKEYVEMIRDAMCTKCNQIFLDKRKNPNNLKKHMEKHLLQEKAKKKIQIHKIPESCTYCDVPYIGDIVEHVRYCSLRKVDCKSHIEASMYSFIESLCNKHEHYINEPHSCQIKCRECEKIFKVDRSEDAEGNTKNSIWEHFKECEKREDMIAKYTLKKETIVNGRKVYVCHYCEFEYCKCKCDTCGKNEWVNKIHDGRHICYNCAKCEVCHVIWKDVPVSLRSWKFLQVPLCNKCC